MLTVDYILYLPQLIRQASAGMVSRAPKCSYNCVNRDFEHVLEFTLNHSSNFVEFAYFL